MPSPRNTPTPPSIPDFELLKPIGRGSYGEVWLARSVTGVFRVVKVVRRDRFEDERPYRRELEGISRFQAAVSGRPRQLALLHVGRNEEAGYFYYVMEPADDVETGSAIDPERYVPLTLRELFSRRGRLPAAECVQLALELARGLSVLHAANLIHRDIKPSNIIFVQRVPKLADVGLVASSHSAMTCVGTVGYSPPEGPGSVAADLFALGKVLYEIATGLDREEFPRLPADIADAPDAPLLREINALVLRTCDPDPRQRPASADAFARDLELIQAGRSVAFYEALRRRFRVSLVAAGAIAVLAAFGAALFFWRAGILTAANREISQALYRSDLSIAKLAHATGDYGRARAALERQIPRPGQTDLRGIEWNILAHAVRGDGIPLEPATNGIAILSIAADPTGRWLAAAFADDTAALWDLHTRKVVRRLPNVRVLGGFTSDSLLVVDEPTPKLRNETVSNDQASIIQSKHRLLEVLPQDDVLLVTISKPPILEIASLPSLAQKWQYDIGANWPNHNVSAAEVSADRQLISLGLFVEIGAIRSRQVCVIDLVSKSNLWSKPVSSPVVWLRLSPNGDKLCANAGGLAPTLLESRTGTPLGRLDGHTSRVQDATFSPDGNFIATGGADRSVRIWNPTNCTQIELFQGMERPISALAWMPDGNTVIAGTENGEVIALELGPTRIRDSAAGFHADVAGDLLLSPEGNRIAITSSTNSIAIVKTSNLETETILKDAFQPVMFGKDGNSMLALRHDLSPARIDLDSGALTSIGPPAPTNFSLAAWSLSPKEDYLGLTDQKGNIARIDIKSGNWVHGMEPASNAVWAITFSPSGTEILTGSSSGIIRSWAASTLRPLGVITTVAGEPQTLAISPSGRWLIVGLYSDSTIRVYDLTLKEWKAILHSHRRFPTALCFDSHESRLISTGADGRIIFWRVPEFDEVASFELEPSPTRSGDEGISSFRLAPDRSVVAAMTEDGRLRVWRTD